MPATPHESNAAEPAAATASVRTRAAAAAAADAGGEVSFRAPLPEELASGVFTDVELATEKASQFALDRGFQITVRSCAGSVRYLGCRRGRYPKQGRKQPQPTPNESYTSFTKCPYSLKIAPIRSEPGCFTLALINDLHNHTPFPEGVDLDATRRTRASKRRCLDDRQPEPTRQPELCSPPHRQAPAPASHHDDEDVGMHDDRREPDESPAASPFSEAMLHPLLRSRAAPIVNAAPSTAPAPTSVPSAPPAPPASVAVSNVSFASLVSVRTDASATNHLGSLRLGEAQPDRIGAPESSTPRPRGAGASVPRHDECDSDEEDDDDDGETTTAGGGMDAEGALRAVLVLAAPPFEAMLGAVCSLDSVQAQAALDWLGALVHMLELQRLMFAPSAGPAALAALAASTARAAPGTRPSSSSASAIRAGDRVAGPAVAAAAKAAEAAVALRVVLRRPPHHATMRQVGALDARQSQAVQRWVGALQTMLEAHLEALAQPWALLHTANASSPPPSSPHHPHPSPLAPLARLDLGQARELHQWLRALLALLETPLGLLDPPRS